MAKSRSQTANEEFEQQMATTAAPFLEILTNPKSEDWGRAITVVVTQCPPALQQWVARQLIESVVSGSQKRQRGGAASLVAMGKCVASPVARRLLACRSEEAQIRLVEVLSMIGRRLPPRERVPIQTDLGLALFRTTSVDVATAILQADRALKPTPP